MAENLEKFYEALAEKKGACSLSKVTFSCDVASQLVQRRREVSYDFAINLAQEQNKHLLRSMTTSGNKQLITGQRSTTLLMQRSDRCNLCRKIGLESEWKGVNLRLCAHIICGYFLPRAWSVVVSWSCAMEIKVHRVSTSWILQIHQCNITRGNLHVCITVKNINLSTETGIIIVSIVALYISKKKRA